MWPNNLISWSKALQSICKQTLGSLGLSVGRGRNTLRYPSLATRREVVLQKSTLFNYQVLGVIAGVTREDSISMVIGLFLLIYETFFYIYENGKGL